MNQLGIKNNIESGSNQQGMRQSIFDEDIPIPSPQQSEPLSQQYQYPSTQSPYMQTGFEPPAADFTQEEERANTQEIVEAIVEERWQRFSDTMADFEIWKSRVNDELIAIKQEIIRTSTRFDNLQKAVLGKVDEYSKSMTDVTAEMKALEKVFQNIINPLTSNIKELSRITTDLKGKK